MQLVKCLKKGIGVLEYRMRLNLIGGLIHTADHARCNGTLRIRRDEVSTETVEPYSTYAVSRSACALRATVTSRKYTLMPAGDGKLCTSYHRWCSSYHAVNVAASRSTSPRPYLP